MSLVFFVSHAFKLQPFVFLCGEGSRSRSYGRTAALRLIVQPKEEDEEKDDQNFLFFQVKERRWNKTDRENPKYSGENLSQCHFVHQNSHIDQPGLEPRPPWWEVGD
jgi:hypothetical protein